MRTETKTITKYEDIIDSRDIIARIEYLEGEVDDDGKSTLDVDEEEELRHLHNLADEANGCSDWQHGETLIRDSYFRDYAEELAEDCGMIHEGAAWPNNCIDWDRAARELQMDYTCVDFDGVTYWIRS